MVPPKIEAPTVAEGLEHSDRQETEATSSLIRPRGRDDPGTVISRFLEIDFPQIFFSVKKPMEYGFQS